MPTSAYYNRVVFIPTTGGLGAFTVRAAAPGARTPADAGIPAATTVSYTAVSYDLTQWECGQGTYSAGVLARTTLRDSSTGAFVNFTNAPTIQLDFLAQDITQVFNVVQNGGFPITSTDNAVVRWDGTTGLLIQNSNVTISDTGNMTWSSSGVTLTQSAGLFQFVGADRYVLQSSGGTIQPIWDLIDNNTWAGSGGLLRFHGKDNAGVGQVGAIINGGLADKTTGNFKGDMDLIVFGPGGAIQCLLSITGATTPAGLIPGTTNAYQLGSNAQRWANLNTFGVNLANANAIVGRNAADSGNLEIAKIDAANSLLIYGGLLQFPVAGTSATFIVPLTISSGGGIASSTQTLLVQNGASYGNWFVPKATAGAYNGLVAVNDSLLAFSAGAIDTGAFVIAPWSNSTTGLRLTNTEIKVSGQFELINALAPAQITANQNDYNPAGLATTSTLRLNSDASRDINGLAGGADGRIIIIHNIGANTITLKDENAGSTAANRFALTADIALTTDTVTMLQYDSTTTRWRAVGGTGSSSGAANVTRRTITGADTAGVTDKGNIIEVTSGTFSLAFTAAATLTNGWWTTIYNHGTGDVTLDPNGAETIDGLTTWVLYPGGAITVQCDGSAFHSVLLAPMRKQFDANGTFTKPGVGTYIRMQTWGAGGSGGRGRAAATAVGGGGGGGGAYVEHLLPFTSFGTTETITIGAGGTAQTVDSGNGTTGGNTTVGSIITAYGGGPGIGAGGSGVAGTGGGGGGNSSAGLVGNTNGGGNGGNPIVMFGDGTSAAVAGIGLGIGGGNSSAGFPGGWGSTANHVNGNHNIHGGGGGGGTLAGTDIGVGGNSTYGGAGGGGGQSGATAAGAAGTSSYGGGGGGGGTVSGTVGAAGTSTFGGAGGVGANGANVAGSGVQPGGGGGGSQNANSGAGAAGRVILYIW